MRAALLFAYAALALSPALPVFEHEGDLFRPRGGRSPVIEGLELTRGFPTSRSVVAAGLPGFLSLLALPFAARGDLRRAAAGSLALAIAMSAGVSSLLAYYGGRRAWGAWVLLGLTLALAGAAAVALRSSRQPETPS